MAFLRLGALIGLALLAASCARLDRDSSSGQWCAYGGGREGYENCGYESFRQCMAAVRGVGVSCRPNPRGVYREEPVPRRRVRATNG